MADSYRPPAGAAAAAERALRWIKEGHAGSGFTDVGRTRAAQLARRESLSLETVKRMYSFFSRHEVDKQGKDFDNMTKPSPGRVAWDAWGGDAGYSWAKRIVESVEEKAVKAQTSVFMPILKMDKQSDGSLLVTGIATDSSVDSDQQICDQEWLKSAMPRWFQWGNIREQHSNIAAGVATEYEVRDGQHWITGRVVDPGSVKKVEAGVLKGFSVGISGPRVIKDDKAAGGRIVDGEIVEISLVDRPANPTCMLSLAKAVAGELVEVEEMVEKREVSGGERERLAEEGNAMPDGSYPIANRQDLKNAILAFGRAKDPEAVKRHIIRRAKELGATNLLPESWTEGKKSMEESAAVAEESETKEPPVEEKAGKAAEESSQKPGEESSQKPGEESSRPGGVAGVAGKAAEGACPHCGDALSKMGEMVTMMYEKMCGPNESASKSQSEDIAKAVEAIEARVSDIEKTAKTAVAPVRTRVDTAKSADVPDPMKIKAAAYRAKALEANDARLRDGYLALAAEIEKSL